MPEYTSTTRTRAIASPDSGETQETIEFPDGPPSSYGRVLPKFPSGRQITVSEGHPFRQSGKKDKGDIGGPFFTSKSYVEVKARQVRKDVQWKQYWYEAPRRYKYKGPLYAIPPDFIPPQAPNNSPFPVSIHSSDSELNEMGATAIARCKPTNSNTDLAVLLAELKREGLPSMVGSQSWQARSLNAKNAGKDYLNVAFGWKPIVDEVRSFADTISRADVLLKQYERDAGRLVRRKFEFPMSEEVTEEPVNGWLGTYGPATGPPSTSETSSGTNVRVVRKTRKVWFSGAFMYHLDPGKTPRGKMSRYASLADKLFGTDITPEVLWELAPWSWAVDWFSNTGDVISNVASFARDGLVMHHGYVMEHTIVKHTYDTYGYRDYTGPRAVTPVSFVTETKKRVQANPFGFGISWDGLSPFQISIAAALGLSKGRS